MPCWVMLELNIDPSFLQEKDKSKVTPRIKGSLSREVDVHLSIGRVELREIIKEGLTKEWQRGWQREARGRHVFSIQPKVGKIWLCNSLTCRDSVKLCRLRLGHCGLNNSLCIIGKHVSGLYECVIL